ncbi:tetratricopeptide repeat protein [Novipirellula sp. SH528]|uniref:tetratricopeptide repeat protein n=1 Tax=Novipirellula sp. SH528 TaxID=3454466 RepID=UPI003FA04A17
MSKFTYVFLPLLFTIFSPVMAQPPSPVDDDPYAKTFDDFEWDETQESFPIPGAVAVGTVIPTEHSIAIYEQRVRRSPSDHFSWTMLGRLFLYHAKEADDLPAYGRATEALEKAVSLSPDYMPARMALASAYNSQHRFAEGLELVQAISSANPQSPTALALVFDSQLELGRYDAARKSLEKLRGIEDSPPVLARAARLAELGGDVEQAISLLDQAISSLQTLSALDAEYVWYLWRKGTLLLQHGEVAAATSVLERALGIAPDDPAVLESLAHAQQSAGDLSAAITTVTRLVEMHSPPPAMALLGDLYAADGKSAAAQQWFDKAEAAMREEQEVAGDAHARELAMFLADHDRHPDEAVKLARKDLLRRQDIYSYDALAWCLFKAGKVEEARSQMREAMKLGTRDPMLAEHAAKIQP